MVIDEQTLRERMQCVLSGLSGIGSVTGVGRSGAIASVFASHLLGVPFVPYGATAPTHLGKLLIIDTARASGRTLRKAERRYSDCEPIVVACFEEPPRVSFWYENKNRINPPKRRERMKYYGLTSGEYSDFRFDGIVAHPKEQDMKALLEEYLKTSCKMRDWDEEYFDFQESAFILWLTLEKGFIEIDYDTFHTHDYSISIDENGNINY